MRLSRELLDNRSFVVYMKEKIDLCTNMLKGANIEGEDEREDTIQDMEGLFMFLSKLKLKQNSRT